VKFENEYFNYYFGNKGKAVQKVFDQYYGSFELKSGNTTLALTDGQTRGVGLNTLNEIKSQLKDSAEYFAALRIKREKSEESKWGSTALSDMAGGFSSDEENLLAIKKQIQGFESAEVLAKKVAPTLPAFQREYLTVNMTSNIQVMLGLCRWLENIMMAKIAMNRGNYQPVEGYLSAASKVLDTTFLGMELKQSSAKWKHWHHGDRKMNMINVKKVTEETLKFTVNGEKQ
jgi:hypothetical protein